jgi:acyl carrier protein
MAVVAEKTGYPSEMLNLDMGLESDLGIDSIKRVEILSAMRTKAPSLPEVDAGAMANLRTLGQIVGYLREQLGGSAPAPVAAAPVAAPPKASSSVDVESLLMSVVADKTGYPAEMLNLDMGLESDLGIDSIKRVEILSAMRTKAPSLPEVDAGAMANLRTLGQIVAYLREQLGGPSDDPNGGGGGGGKPSTSGAADAKGGEAADPRLGRYATKAVARPGPGFGVSGLSGEGSLLLTPDGHGVAEALAARLRSRGLAVVVGNDLPADAKGAVLLHGLGPFADANGALTAQGLAFRIARGLAPRVSAQGGVFVTTQDTGADFGLSCSDLTRALSGGLVGLSRTAGIEWPLAGVKGLDVELGARAADAVAEAIERELFTGGPDRDVGLAADGRRLVLESVPARAIQPGPVRVDASSVIVATGGARGVTAACLIALARRARCAFALLGRTALEDEPAAVVGVEGEANLKRALLAAAAASGEKVSPALINSRLSKILANREVQSTLQAIHAAGARALYIAADVNDPARLSLALAEVRRSLGPITGLVHGAGVIADKLIAEKTDDQFQRVFDTKVAGLNALLAATANDPLSMVCLFSSVAGRCGNAGQCDYAMANQTLNTVALAESRRRPGVLWKSLGWGPWEGGMVTPALKARFEAAGVPLIPLDGGAELFAREVLSGAADEVDVVMGGAPRAEALLPTEAPTERRYDVFVSAASHPYLQDHSIQGVPVVPVVLALEWFARAAQMSAPEFTFVGCRAVKVLKGVRLGDFQRGEWLTVITRKLHNGDGAVLAVELRGATGVVHYRGEAVMASAYPAPSAPSGLTRTLEAWPHALYGDVLFHGPDFQVICGLDGVSDAGTRASVAGVSAQGWGAEGWVTDAAALDGGLQLALLWSRRVLGGRSLPTSFGEYKSYMDGAPEGLMQVELSSRVVERSRAVSDIRLTDAAGRLVAELTGVETHLLPS